VHDSISLNELWHRRLDHLHYRALPVLGKMVTGLPHLCVEHDGICRGCALGTNAKGSFPSSDSRSNGILDFVHSDLCGPMTVASLSGSGLMDETMEVVVTGWTLRDIWVSYLHSRTQGEKDEVRPFRQEGYIYWIS
jgi:hypothetical protein